MIQIQYPRTKELSLTSKPIYRTLRFVCDLWLCSRYRMFRMKRKRQHPLAILTRIDCKMTAAHILRRICSRIAPLHPKPYRKLYMLACKIPFST